MTDAKLTITITSLLHRAYWRIWQETTGKLPTFDEIHDPRHVRKIAAFERLFTRYAKNRRKETEMTPLSKFIANALAIALIVLALYVLFCEVVR